jgi:hypothetical protein
MLDIGALDTDVPKFWLKDHLVAFLPGRAAASGNPPPPKSGEDAVIPPEQYFKE